MTVVACSGEQLVGSIVGIYTVPIKHDLAAGFSKINVQDFQSPTATRKRKGKKDEPPAANLLSYSPRRNSCVFQRLRAKVQSSY